MTNRNDFTAADMFRQLQTELSPTYGAGEAKAMARLIFHALKGWNLTDLVIHNDYILSEYIIDKINLIKDRLLRHEPIQYILGEAYFFGMNLSVTPDTLIPRPETEELVDLIIKENQETDLSILDIGTGSGAIAIALARNMRFPKVSAIDISGEALKVAGENARSLNARIKFIHDDIFTYMPPQDSLDIIVSNPPYIDMCEKKDMDKNVLDYEPHSALFVPDEDPLIYYRRIISVGIHSLRDGGRIYLEINPRHDKELKTLLERSGYQTVGIIKDSNGRNRFISAR